MRKVFSLFFLFLITLHSYASFFKELNYTAQFGVTVGDGLHTPFWLMANKHGVASDKMPNSYLRAMLSQPFDLNDAFSYSWGVDLVGGLNLNNPFYIQQLYFGLKYKPIVVELGSLERIAELRNPTLSSGSLTLSTNARPIPQLRVSIANYISVPFTNNWFQIKGHLAYGMFTDNHFQRAFTSECNPLAYPVVGKYVINAIYHSKALYGKIGNEAHFPLNFEGGLEMAARFGGEIYLNDGTSFKAPNGIRDFFKILIPLKGGSDSPIMDQQNVLGDHLGSWNFALNYHLKNWKIRLYYEHQFNDHSQMFGEYSWRDGMWGVEFQLPSNRVVNNIVIERINSRDQTGAIYHDSNEMIPEQISAVDDYYNHGRYSGWQHGGQAIANPLFISPLYNTDARLFFMSNRMVAHHIGISGQPFSFFGYRMLISLADHWGTYIQPFEEIKYNRNYLFEVSFTLPKNSSWQFLGEVAIDRSDLIGNNWGITFSLKKNGFLNRLR